MRCWSAVTAAGGQLQVRAGAWHREEDAVVAVVVAEATDLGQPDAVSVEADDLVEALGVSGDAQLHRWLLRVCSTRSAPYLVVGALPSLGVPRSRLNLVAGR